MSHAGFHPLCLVLSRVEDGPGVTLLHDRYAFKLVSSTTRTSPLRLPSDWSALHRYANCYAHTNMGQRAIHRERGAQEPCPTM
jgi:hypothetical protein